MKKNKKNVLFSIVILFILLFITIRCSKDNTNEHKTISNLESRSSQLQSFQTGCLPDMSSCTFLGRKTKTISIPGACDYVDVGYDLYDCGNGNFTFDNFQAFPDIYLCEDYFEWWWSLSGLDLEYSIDSFNYAASVITEKLYMSEFVLTNPEYTCPNQAAQATFYSMGCYRYCINGLSGKEGIPWDNIQKIKCGDKCCIRMTSYCVNDFGEVIPQGPSFTQTGGQNCGDLPFFCIDNIFIPNPTCERPCGAP